MPYDGSGVFTREYNWEVDRDNGIKILAERMDGEFDGMAGAFNQVVLRNGVAPMTGTLVMGSNAISGVTAGSESTPAIRFADSTNSGLFLGAGGSVGITVGGNEVGLFNGAGFKADSADIATLTVDKITSDTTIEAGGNTKTDTLTVTKSATVGTTLTVTTSTKTDTLEVVKSATVGTTLTVTGKGTFSDNVDVTKEVTTKDLNVTGVAEFDGEVLLPLVAPGVLADGHIWATSSGLFARIDGDTQGPFAENAGYELIETITPTAASNNLTTADIPTTFADLLVVIDGIGTTGGANTFNLSLSDNSAANFSAAIQICTAAGSDYVGALHIPGYLKASGVLTGGAAPRGGAARFIGTVNAGGASNTLAWAFQSGNGITNFRFATAGTFAAGGTIKVYGIKR